jgi:hypothetical protein
MKHEYRSCDGCGKKLERCGYYIGMQTYINGPPNGKCSWNEDDMHFCNPDCILKWIHEGSKKT